jgi:putative FmdB family regulatory protein
MPLYTYECRKCDRDWPVFKTLAAIDSPEACPHCESTATDRIIKHPPGINKVWSEGFNPALGKVIRSRAHLAEELKKYKGETGREMVEIGDEPMEKIEKKLTTERESRMQARWDEPVGKIAQEVLGEGIAS